MEVKIIEEAGYEQALYAMSLSYYKETEDKEVWWKSQKEKAIKRSSKMCHQSGGHNDFLTLTTVYLEIHAPLYWWKQADRYQIGFRKLSSSTMHTLMKTGVRPEDFEYVPNFFDMDGFNDWIKNDKPTIEEVANELPDGFLQRRVVCTNYMTLRNIIFQRRDHRLNSWQTFCDAIYDQCEHPEFLPEKNEK